MKSKKLVVILVLVAIAAVVGFYDNFIRRPHTYITPNTTIIITEHNNTTSQK